MRGAGAIATRGSVQQGLAEVQDVPLYSRMASRAVEHRIQAHGHPVVEALRQSGVFRDRQGKPDTIERAVKTLRFAFSKDPALKRLAERLQGQHVVFVGSCPCWYAQIDKTHDSWSGRNLLGSVLSLACSRV